MGEGNQVAILGSTLLFLLYAMTTLFCLIRTIRLHKFSPNWKPSKLFYLSVLFQSCLRSICFLIMLLLGKSQMTTKTVFLLLSIPDSLFIVSYILLLWQVILVFSSAHTNIRITIAIFAKLFKIEQHGQIGSYVAFCLTVWIGTQMCLYILAGNGIIHFKNISREVGVCNFSLAAVAMIGMIVLQVRFSGVPLRTASWKAKLNRINLVTGFWTLARILQGVLDVLDTNKDTSLATQMSNSQSNTIGSTYAAYLFSVLIISEIVCILMVLDYAFMGIFVFHEEEAKQKRSTCLRQLSFESSNSLLELPLQLRLNLKDITFSLELHAEKPTLGKIYNGKYQERNVFIRKMTFSRLSTYVLEDFSDELDSYVVEHKHILPITGVIFELPVIYTMCPYIEPGSLFRLIHRDKRKFSASMKVNFAKQVASALMHIHATGRVHGHLTSENILLSGDDHIYISDFGMNKIKKYAGIVFGYTNKSAWSSPEILRDKRLTPLKQEPSDDIYSFGIFLWEIFTESIPFEGLEVETIYEMITTEGYRPEIPKNIASDIVEIILACWQDDPNERPPFDLVLKFLKKVSV